MLPKGSNFFESLALGLILIGGVVAGQMFFNWLWEKIWGAAPPEEKKIPLDEKKRVE